VGRRVAGGIFGAAGRSGVALDGTKAEYGHSGDLFHGTSSGTAGYEARGAPRQILKEAVEADWSKDGSQLQVVRVEPGQEILEYPIEKKIYETDGWIGNPHISLDGQQIAFVQHPLPGDDIARSR
jgi:hypothetical protein